MRCKRRIVGVSARGALARRRHAPRSVAYWQLSDVEMPGDTFLIAAPIAEAQPIIEAWRIHDNTARGRIARSNS
jgi:hypothetical protein